MRQRFVPLQISLERGCQRLVLFLIGEFKCAARSGNGFRVAAVFGIHGREHLQDGWLRSGGKFRGLFELRQAINEVSFCRQDPAKVKAIIRIFRCKRDGLLDVDNRFVQIIGVSERDSQVILDRKSVV